MYEDRTYEALLQEMLVLVPNNLDKREGSVIYDALAPAAAKLAQCYVDLATNVNLFFTDTTGGEFLERRAADFGITRKPAIQATRQAAFNIAVSEGTRFFVDGIYFVVQQGGTTAILQCETPGEAGNIPDEGIRLLPVDNISGLTSAFLGAVLMEGIEEETDAALLERLLAKMRRPATSGNANQYRQWAIEVPGVGDAKVFPLWNGGGTVKVVLLDANKQAPEPSLVTQVQHYIDPEPGMGEGQAPIGAQVIVVGAAAVPIDVSVDVTLVNGASISTVKELIELGLQEYLQTLAFKDVLIRYTRIANVILDIPFVIDYANLTVNGQTANIQIDLDEVAVLGTVTVT